MPEVPSSDPYGPYKRYTDPDPNIRFEMMRQQQWRKGMTRAYWAPPQETPDEPRNCRSATRRARDDRTGETSALRSKPGSGCA